MAPKCNKCKVGEASEEGDSWCVGCSALELAQTLLKQPWRRPGVLRVLLPLLLPSLRLSASSSAAGGGRGRTLG